MNILHGLSQQDVEKLKAEHPEYSPGEIRMEISSISREILDIERTNPYDRGKYLDWCRFRQAQQSRNSMAQKNRLVNVR